MGKHILSTLIKETFLLTKVTAEKQWDTAWKNRVCSPRSLIIYVSSFTLIKQ